jgi:hypothetical protein
MFGHKVKNGKIVPVLTSARRREDVDIRLKRVLSLTPGAALATEFNYMGGWMGARACLDVVGRRKSFAAAGN